MKTMGRSYDDILAEIDGLKAKREQLFQQSIATFSTNRRRNKARDEMFAVALRINQLRRELILGGYNHQGE